MNKYIIIFYMALCLSCSRENLNTCEKNLKGTYCIEIGIPSYINNARYFSIEDKNTREVLTPTFYLALTPGQYTCIDIIVKLPEKRRIIKVTSWVDTKYTEFTDTVNLCSTSWRIIR